MIERWLWIIWYIWAGIIALRSALAGPSWSGVPQPLWVLALLINIVAIMIQVHKILEAKDESIRS